MASDKNFVSFVVGQISGAGDIEARPLFGEYGLYKDGKLFGLICDDRLYIKQTGEGRAFIGDVVEAPPYHGAKPSFLIEEKLEDGAWLSELVRISAAALPLPKSKKKKAPTQ